MCEPCETISPELKSKLLVEIDSTIQSLVELCDGSNERYSGYSVMARFLEVLSLIIPFVLVILSIFSFLPPILKYKFPETSEWFGELILPTLSVILASTVAFVNTWKWASAYDYKTKHLLLLREDLNFQINEIRQERIDVEFSDCREKLDALQRKVFLCRKTFSEKAGNIISTSHTLAS